MPDAQINWRRALLDATAFLGRFADPFTARERDDLAQEATFAAWLRTATRGDPRRLRAFIRTIARRLRARALHEGMRSVGSAVADKGGRDRPDREWPASDWPGSDWPNGEGGASLRVSGVLVPVDWLLAQLVTSLGRLKPVNRQLLLGYYEGFSCCELALRFGLTEEAVKVRIHRNRAILRRRLEVATRAAGHFES